MAISVKSNWITEHRRWEDVFSAAIGFLIVLSPILNGAGATTAVIVNVGLAGVLIFALALMELVYVQRWEEVLEMICGAWVVASPIWFGYGGAIRIWHFVLGALVVILALFELWQDRNRRTAS